jgi:predicted alpha/beta-hydrolase family hydrolase
LAIGGKSMGGRAASLIAQELFDASRIRKLVLFGYPFHPPTKPEHLRTSHLENLTCPTLLLQGERDPFGTKDEVPLYPLSRKIRTAWLADGDHDFKPRVASGHTWKENLAQAADDAANFIYA